MASGLAPRFSPHRRKGCRGCAVPLLLVLPLLPACPQVLRGRLEALGGEVLCWGRKDRPHLGQAAGSPLTHLPLLLALDAVQQLGVCWAVDPAPTLLEEARASVRPSVHAVPRLHLLRAVRAKGKPVSCPWTPGLQFSFLGPCPSGFPFPQLPLPHPSPPPGCWLLVELSLLEQVEPPKTGGTCSPLIPVPRTITDEPPWGPDHRLSPPYLLASTVCRTQPNIQSGIQCPTSQLPPASPLLPDLLVSFPSP